MKAKDWFDDSSVIGRMPADSAINKLREVGENEKADLLEYLDKPELASKKGILGIRFKKKKPRAWEHTSHAFGFLPKNSSGTELCPIMYAGCIEADRNLIGAKIKITLNRLRVVDYPGDGMHRILIDFYCQNQVDGDDIEHVHFSSTYRIQEGQRAGIAGYPVFRGLNVGPNGVSFRCYTVNIGNDDDDRLLEFLESDSFTSGLKLVSTVQPAIVPFSDMIVNLTKSIASRHKNIPVQDFYLGLDFDGSSLGARLAEGDYIAVQVPESLHAVWDWDKWAYDPRNGLIVSTNDGMSMIPFNYVVFGVSKYSE